MGILGAGSKVGGLLFGPVRRILTKVVSAIVTSELVCLWMSFREVLVEMLYYKGVGQVLWF